MRPSVSNLVIATLSLVGLLTAGIALWYQAVWFHASVHSLADDVRVSLIAPDGRVIYDTEGTSIPNQANRAEVESVLKDGKPCTVVRESPILNRQMIFHARRVGKLIVRFAVPRANVDAARRHVRIGLLAACAVGALAIAILFFVLRRAARRLDHLAAQRDAQRKLVTELRQLEDFRKDFISNVTHELKTPLTGILGAVDILSDDTAALTSADRRELLTVLHDHATRLNALAEDILSLSSLERAKTEHHDFVACDVSDIVRTAVNLQQPLAENNGVKLSLLPLPPTLNLNPSTSNSQPSTYLRPCDSRLVEAAVTNLIANALRHSGSKSIEVSLAPTAGGQVAITVTDHGIGIPPEAQPHVFERFYRVDRTRSRAQGGTGLGLAIVKHIALLHEGSVSLKSTPGAGSAFTITI